MGWLVGALATAAWLLLRRPARCMDLPDPATQPGNLAGGAEERRCGIDAALLGLSGSLESGADLHTAFAYAGLGCHVDCEGAIDGERIEGWLCGCRRSDEPLPDVVQAARGLEAALRLGERLGCSHARGCHAVRKAYGRLALRRDLQRNAMAVPKATVRLLSALPALTVLLAQALGAHPLAFLLGGTPGALCLAIGLGCYAAGLAWMRILLDEGHCDG